LFGSLCSLVLLVNLARVVFAPLLSELMVAFDFGEATAGLVATAVWVGSALLRLPAGWLLTRVPRHRVVLGTGAVLTGASAVAATADSVAMLVVGALLMGTASGAYFVAANPLVSELYPDRVGRALGIHGISSQVAAVVAAPFVGVALLFDWRMTFVIIGVGASAVTVILWAVARQTELPDVGAADRHLLRAARAEWRVVLFGIVVIGFAGFVWQGLFNFYELYMHWKGIPERSAGVFLTAVFVAGLPAFVLSGRLADRLPKVPYLLAILVAFVACVLGLTVASGFLPLFVLTVVTGYVIHSLIPALDAYLLDTLPDETRGSAYAVFSAGMMVIQATGSSVVGALVEAGLGYDLIFTAFAVGLGVVVLGLGGLRAVGRLPT
jgi:predicted MFS family arabinose efflux permease